MFLAGVGGGVTGSVAGLASLVTYPVLLAVGLPPVTANVSNTVALVFSGMGSVSASADELAGQRGRLRELVAASICGGAIGSAILLVAPATSFKLVVPWLVAGASAAVLLPRRLDTFRPGRVHRTALIAGTFLISIYGGYFGAAAGVFMLALILAMTAETLPRANAAKNVVGVVFNGIAALAFILFGPVRWLAVLPLAFGFLIGGRLGPAAVRRLPPGPLRVGIATTGIGLAIALGWQAYH
jgi:uncharacterized protein